MKVLITGASGQIGLDLISHLQHRGDEIVATDLRQPIRNTKEEGVAWRLLDVTDADAVDAAIAHHAPDIVFHLAAILSAKGEQHPELTYQVNQTGTWNVFTACRKANVKRVIFTSTIAVYGPGLPDPTPEAVPLTPQTMYGITKVAGELLADYFSRRYQMDIRGVRFPGLISATLPGGGSSDYALFMYLEGSRSGHYEAFCRPDTRIPLMYMPDGLRALVTLALAPRPSLSRCIYNIAAFSPRADEIAQSIRAALPQVHITYAPDPKRQGILDSWPRALDDSVARAEWGWRPSFTLDQMTADLLPKMRQLLADNPAAPAH